MKKSLSNFLLIVLLALCATAFALPGAAEENRPSPEGQALRMASYDGVWSGTVHCLYDPGLWPEDECDIGLSFQISGTAILVTQVVRSKSGKETTSAVNPGNFRFAKLGANAIAVSLGSGVDEDGTWIETWSFAMTLKDPDHMVVHWTRVVNNVDLPMSRKGSKFSSVGMGELVRKTNTR